MTRADRIRSSALWAAWGDALGFISELASNTRVIKHRTGDVRVTETKPWVRRLGGQYGAEVELPAGCYSDDTQLRLATLRAIRGDGRFDVRNFSKVELVAWQAYALGGGRSTKAAAVSLSQKSHDWFSNFFSGGSSARYQDAGGNGGAIRIQPHVWAARDTSSWETFLRDVVRNTVTTHGHPRAIIGAALHAGSLARTIETGEVPGPHEWNSLLDRLEMLPSLVHEDEDLNALWLPTWEKTLGTTIESAIASTIDECRIEFEVAKRITETNPRTAYEELIIATKAKLDATRGSATKTAMLAIALAWLRSERPAEGLIEAANVLGTDTDSIASMAGALLGAVSREEPPGPVLDAEYIVQEAQRCASIAEGAPANTFVYPDPHHWSPPTASADLVGLVDGHLNLAGLGILELDGPQWPERGRFPAVWQWGRLSFGQSVVIRRRVEPARMAASTLGPGWQAPRLPEAKTLPPRSTGQVELFSSTPPTETPGPFATSERQTWSEHPTVDEAFELVRANRFPPPLVGKYFLEFAARPGDGHTLAMAFAAMVGKAWRSRQLQ